MIKPLFYRSWLGVLNGRVNAIDILDASERFQQRKGLGGFPALGPGREFANRLTWRTVERGHCTG